MNINSEYLQLKHSLVTSHSYKKNDKLEITKLLMSKCLFTHVESMLKVFGKSILNGVFEQIHLSTDKKVFKIPKYQILNL